MNLYFDIAGGASGDMLLSALSGPGFNTRFLGEELNKTGIKLKIAILSSGILEKLMQYWKLLDSLRD